MAKAQFELIRIVNAPELIQSHELIEIIPTGIFLSEYNSPDLASRQNTAIHNRAEIRQVLEEIKAAQLEHHFSLNELLPRLTFSAEGIFEGLSGDRDLRAASVNRFDSDATYELGFDFEFPLQNRQARFSKRKAELALSRLDRKWQAAIETVKRDVLVAIQDFETSQLLLKRQRNIFRSSNERLNFLEKRRYQIPREGTIPSLQLGQLLDVQQEVAASKADFAGAYADRQRAQFDLNRASGVLVQPDFQGLGDPGSYRYFAVFRQHIEGERFYRQHAKELSAEISATSKKPRPMWRSQFASRFRRIEESIEVPETESWKIDLENSQSMTEPFEPIQKPNPKSMNSSEQNNQTQPIYPHPEMTTKSKIYSSGIKRLPIDGRTSVAQASYVQSRPQPNSDQPVRDNSTKEKNVLSRPVRNKPRAAKSASLIPSFNYESVKRKATSFGKRWDYR